MIPKKKHTYQELNNLMFTDGNPKTDKNKHIKNLDQYLIKRLNLAPAKISGFETCASRSEGCTDACLHEAGNPVHMPQKTLGRVNRTLLLFKDTARFISMATREIRNHEIYCNKNNFKPVVRLNTTSDISWEIHGIFELFPAIQFYDYTKIKKRVIKYLNNEYPKNYHLTFSMNEINYNDCMEVLSNGGNVAVVFRKNLPATYKGYRVVNGDISDLRFLDPNNSIVGLKAKGKAKTDMSGFVLD